MDTTTSDMTSGIAALLEALSRDESFRVDAVLKEGGGERTERVYLPGAEGEPEQGPFIRKYFSPDCGMGGEYERVWRVQQAGGRFVHLPRIYECADLGDRRVVVMEFIEGQTLEELVADQGPSVELAAEEFPQLCEAVRQLHEGFEPPIVHRDLKPSNIMVSDGRLVVIDLGIARTFKEGAVEDTRHFGTRLYAPPEQFGFGQTDVRSDVYAMGAILYFLLTGESPDAQARERDFEHPKVPEALRCVISRACSFDPKARFGSAAQLEEAFEAALEGKAMPADAAGAADAVGAGTTAAAAAAGAGGPQAAAAGRRQQAGQQRQTGGAARSRDAGSSYVVTVPQEGVSYLVTVPPSPVEEEPPSKGKTIASNIAFGLGLVWNVLIGLVLLLLLCIFIHATISPSGSMEDLPFVLRAFIYAADFLLLFCPIGFAIRARNVEKRLWPNVKRRSIGDELKLCALLIVIFFIGWTIGSSIASTW